MEAKYSNSIFLLGNQNRYEVNYVLKNGHNTYALVDADTKEDAESFIAEHEDVKSFKGTFVVG